MNTKYCYKCKEHHPLDSFGNNRSKPDGKQDECKPCRKILAKGWAKDRRVIDRANEGRTLRSDDLYYRDNEHYSAVMEALGSPERKW